MACQSSVFCIRPGHCLCIWFFSLWKQPIYKLPVGGLLYCRRHPLSEGSGDPVWVFCLLLQSGGDPLQAWVALYKTDVIPADSGPGRGNIHGPPPPPKWVPPRVWRVGERSFAEVTCEMQMRMEIGTTPHPQCQPQGGQGPGTLGLQLR